MLAAAVVEAVTGRPYVDTLQELALNPAAMGLTFTQADEVVTHRVAAPHTAEGSAARVLRDEGWQRHWQLPAWDVPGGGVLSNARDLMRYGEYLMSEDAPVGVFDIHGHQGALGKSSGLAWTLSRVGAHVVASHDGLTVGYATNMTVVPSLHLSYCVLSNSVGGRPVVRAIEAAIQDALLGTDDCPNLDRRHPAELQDFAGTFDFGFYGMVRVGLVADDGLSMSTIPGSSPYAFVLDPPTAELMVPSAVDQLMILEPERHRGSLIGVMRDSAGRVVALNNGRIAFRVN
jgi:CubicO group peptidase (beta-lactamase class C family)